MWSFINHITSALSRPRLGNKKAPTLWPSEAAAIITNEYNETINIGKCRRAVFFRYLLDNFYFSKKYEHYKELVSEIEQKSLPTDPYLRWIWKAGDLYEEYLLQISKESGIYVTDQTAVYIPEYNVSGKIDIIVINPETQKLTIVEAKSVYGYNANYVLGTPAERKRGKLGVPKNNYLMQLGIYQYWFANQNDNFGEALLVCGARDTGRFAEYKLKVALDENKEDDISYIWYAPHFPNSGAYINSNISIESILKEYKYIQNCTDSGIIPERDFNIRYSDEYIDTLYERNQLAKNERIRYEKRKSQIEQNQTRINKQIEKGDWQCNFCQYKNICYKGITPKEISI